MTDWPFPLPRGTRVRVALRDAAGDPVWRSGLIHGFKKSGANGSAAYVVTVDGRQRDFSTHRVHPIDTSTAEGLSEWLE